MNREELRLTEQVLFWVTAYVRRRIGLDVDYNTAI
jgi:hypothetical protein